MRGSKGRGGKGEGERERGRGEGRGERKGEHCYPIPKYIFPEMH